ncbi:MAG: ABC transporter ATP-binding protein [Proteobacteria bacterium]|nr:ABC transporter ATP-binding protein [Pseudomonadota bacterium]MBU1585231.1 ABC transporter ATP-binding protein [Pseudomonadota bacterium]MBU2454544.1 ABC transporter ATP-binding protein [Pseudomonadota bacterium]MBU2629121.1 ABC transporter ATP-binding protein [Pseudomonadota bacterium]
MIQVLNLNKTYKSTQALKDVNLQVDKGELFAFLGPNGAGKTTTIRILTGLTKLDSGTVRLNGFDVNTPGIDSRRQCGLVPQSINLDRELSVVENLNIHGRLFRMNKEQRMSRIEELLDYVEMGDRKATLVKNLSGGMKRRLMIARALLHSPAILFLDEPTVGLDAGMRRKIWALIKKIQQNGTTIFLTTHYIEEAEFLAGRVAFIDKGAIVVVDTPESLMKQQGTWALDRLKEDDMETLYFNDRKEANDYIAAQKDSFTLRRVNLEDSFLALTGKKVQ